jgi:(p)ppGpp synthase/HD superfamily hydrolase
MAALPTPLARDDGPLSTRALRFAELRHNGQMRATDGAPFVNHPIEVASLLRGHGYPDHVVAAGFLHDVVEKTDAELEQVVRRFGVRTAALVAAVTEDAAIADTAERKAALRRQVAEGPAEAAAVFAADKLARVRDLRAQLAIADEVTPEVATKLAHYRASLEVVDAALPDSALVGELRAELETLPVG